MTPNSKPWQAIVNANAASIPMINSNNLSVVKKTTVPVKSTQGRVVNPKRYSFDDNGGGYLGL